MRDSQKLFFKSYSQNRSQTFMLMFASHTHIYFKAHRALNEIISGDKKFSYVLQHWILKIFPLSMTKPTHSMKNYTTNTENIGHHWRKWLKLSSQKKINNSFPF